MAFVLDSSTTATWAFEDENHPVAEATYALLFLETAIAPALWWYELRNTLLVGERRGRISSTDAKAFLDALRRLPISLASEPDELVTFHLARRHRLTFYDAAYLALASGEGLRLSTLDRALAAAARAEGVGLVEP